MSSLHLYIKPGCPWCMQAVAWLDEEGYRYEKLDVIADDDAFTEMKEFSGQSLAPTLVIMGDSGEDNAEDRKILPDFDVDELKQFLKAEGVKPLKR